MRIARVCARARACATFIEKSEILAGKFNRADGLCIRYINVFTPLDVQIKLSRAI